MAKGDLPAYRGVINDSERKKVGTVALWRKKDFLTGVITYDNGTKYRVALFDTTRNQRKSEQADGGGV